MGLETIGGIKQSAKKIEETEEPKTLEEAKEKISNLQNKIKSLDARIHKTSLWLGFLFTITFASLSANNHNNKADMADKLEKLTWATETLSKYDLNNGGTEEEYTKLVESIDSGLKELRDEVK